MPISLFLKANVQRLWFYWKLYRLNSLSVPSGVANLLMPVDTIFCLPSICVSNPKKSKNIIFLPMGPRGHPEWCDATRSDAGVPEVPFSTKMTKMPLVNLGLTEGQMRSKPSQNNTFHSFALNLSFSEIFGNFDQVDSRRALETIILIWPLERVENNIIVKIIKFSIQWLFMGQNRN